MQFGYINDLLTDPRATLMILLLALPGRMLAISAHEAAHAWVADRCGDPTGRYMGRITLNPLKHLDVVGMIMMLVVGIGWAKPVPVNPRNFRNYRRDDLLVSIAGVTVNLILFLLGTILSYIFLALAINAIPYEANWMFNDGLFRSTYRGVSVLMEGDGYYVLSDLVRDGIYYTGISEIVIAPAFGQIAGYLYEMLTYFTLTNLVLAVFNLIPLPPLDGYHVLNDLFLKRPLFASPRAMQMGQMILYIGVFSGVLTDILSKVYTAVFSFMGSGASALMQMMGFL